MGLSAVLLLVLGCTDDARFVVGDEVTVEGRVTGIDATPMFVDGDGLVTMDAGGYGSVTVRVPARETLCQARGIADFHTLRIGDPIRAIGIASDDRVVRVCVGDTHLLERMDAPGDPPERSENLDA